MPLSRSAGTFLRNGELKALDNGSKDSATRAAKYKKERAARDLERDDIRNKYKIEKKPQDDEEEEEEEEDDGFGASKKVDEDDPVAKAKAMAEEKLAGAKKMFGGLFGK